MLTQKSFFNSLLEFLLNICPAIHQRAAINLRLQLGYHAFQSFTDENAWLEKIKETPDCNTIFRQAAVNLIRKKQLIKLEALLQMGDLEKAKVLFNKEVRGEVFPDEASFLWSTTEANLPNRPQVPPTFLQVRVIEQTIRWFLESSRALKSLLAHGSQGKQEKIIERINEIGCLTDRLKQYREVYWAWIKDNDYDEKIYFSGWAQFLKIGTEIIANLKEYRHIDEINCVLVNLLREIVMFYLKRRVQIPLRREAREEKNQTLELENFRSDDFPDFVNGLSSFYEQMAGILLSEKKDLIEILQTLFREAEETNLPIEILKLDHLRFLDALEDYETEFGQRQRIKVINRCKDRLLWLDNRVSQVNCKACLKDDHGRPTMLGNFGGLLKCAGDTKENQKDLLDSHDYETIMRLTEQQLTRHLNTTSIHDSKKDALHFMGLQRWNSLTPAQGRSVGGGYLIYKTNSKGEVELGIAIDPGFDFVRNLFRMGFSLKDIDIILISHAHPDHLWDFESIIQLLHDLEEKEKITHRINVVFTLGSYKRLEHIIVNSELRRFMNPLVVDIRKEINPKFLEEFKSTPFKFSLHKNVDESTILSQASKYCRWQVVLPDTGPSNEEEPTVAIRPTFAYHNDYSDISDSYGFVIDFTNLYRQAGAPQELSFGYTGDTKWVSDDLYNTGCPINHKSNTSRCLHSMEEGRCWECVASQYDKCQVLLIHLGSLIDHKNADKKKSHFQYYKGPEECEDLMRKKNHPYLMGLIRFLRKMNPDSRKLILIGEFGEELRGGIRADLVNRLQKGLMGEQKETCSILPYLRKFMINEHLSKMVAQRKTWSILPVDVGLDVVFHSYNPNDNKTNDPPYMFLCAMCDTQQSLQEVEYVRFGQDEAIFYLCKTCFKAVPQDVQMNKLRQLYDIGRELKPADENTERS